MPRPSLRRALTLASLTTLGLIAACVGTSSNPSGTGTQDAGTFDSASPTDFDADVGDAHVVVVADTGAPDAPATSDDAASSFDSGPVMDASSPDAQASDAGPDAADAAIDAAPTFDDAGCPIPSGVTVNLADAGIPSSGLVLWLRSDMGVDTLDAVGDGGTVCRWEDVSGNAQSFTPASASPPARVFGGIGSAPALSFGAGQNLSRGGVLGIGATSARTVAVYSQTADTSHRWEAFFQGVDGSPGTYFGLDANTFDTVGNREGVYVTNSSYDSDIATTTNPRSHILSINSFAVGTLLPGALTYDVDGTVRTLTVANSNGNNMVQDFSGANFTSVGYGVAGFTGGMIGEVIVYDRELTAPERTTIEQHFAARF